MIAPKQGDKVYVELFTAPNVTKQAFGVVVSGAAEVGTSYVLIEVAGIGIGEVLFANSALSPRAEHASVDDFYAQEDAP